MATIVQKDTNSLDPAFLQLNALMVMGDLQEAIRVWNETLNKSFESGIEYAQDTVGDWNKPW
jgi:hypothetical protein